MGGASGLWRFRGHNQKGRLVECPTQHLAIAGATNSLNQAIVKNVKRAFHPMSKLAQSAVMRFLTLKGLQHQHIETGLSDIYHKQTFQLPAVEK
jgi:hypothetical protein